MAPIPFKPTLVVCFFVVCASLAKGQHEGHEGWEEETTIPTPMPDASHSSMKPFIHFTMGDHLWFEDWIPRTRGAMAGACVGLFLLGILERWLAAVRAVANIWWRVRTTDFLDAIHQSPRDQPQVARPAIQSNLSSLSEKEKLDGIAELPTEPPPSPSRRNYRCFRARFSAPPMTMNELCRGVLYAAQSALTFAFMLVIMTYQGAFLISIIVGLGFGEMLFGRYTNAHVGLTM